MENHRIVSAVTEHAHLQKRPALRRPNHHDQVVIHLHPTNRFADGVLHVGIGDSVVASRLADSHLDNISCLRTQHKWDSQVNPCPNNAETCGLHPAPVRRLEVILPALRKL